MRGTTGVGAIIGAVLIAVSASSCSSDPELPDQSDAGVKRQAAALERQLTPEAMGFGPGVEQWSCKVRLLGHRESDTLGWARCTGRIDQHETGSSVPVRVTPAGKVRQPQDGTGYSASVMEMFGDDLGKWVLKHSDALGAGTI